MEKVFSGRSHPPLAHIIVLQHILRKGARRIHPCGQAAILVENRKPIPVVVI